MAIRPKYIISDYDLEGMKGILFGSDRTGLMLASVIRSIEENPSEIYINSISINLGMAPQEIISWNDAIDIRLIDAFLRKWNLDGLIARLENPLIIPEQDLLQKFSIIKCLSSSLLLQKEQSLHAM